MRVVIREKATGDITNRNFVIETLADLNDIGFDFVNYEVLIPIDANSVPDYDPRYYVLNVNPDVVSETANETGYRTITDINTLVKRPTTEIVAAAEEAETLANAKVVKLEKQVKTLIIALNAILRQNLGLTLTTKETKAQEKIAAYAVKVSKNDNNLTALIEAINQGLNPDLDSGWESA